MSTLNNSSTGLGTCIFIPVTSVNKSTNTTELKTEGKYDEARFEEPDINGIEPNADKVAGKSSSLYDSQTSDLLNNFANTGSFITDNAKKVKDKDIWQGANLNLSKDDYQGNLNNADFMSTLNYSRMADMLNNKMYLTPSSIGARTAKRGSSGTGIDNIGLGFQKGPQVETQEMRQMRANEKIDAERRAQDIRRQGAIQDRILNIQQNLDAGMVELGKKFAFSKEALASLIAQLVVNKEYGATYDQMLSRAYDVFAQNTRLYFEDKLARFIMKHKSDFIYATLLGKQHGLVVPSTLNQIAQKYIESNAQKFLNDEAFEGMSPEQQKQAITEILTSISTFLASIVNWSFSINPLSLGQM